MNTLKNIGLFFSRYLAQIIVIILGAVIIKIGTSEEVLPNGQILKQNQYFTYGGVALLVAGIISVLYVANMINRLAHMILIFAVLPVGVIALAYIDYRAIQSEIEFRAEVEMHKKEVIQRLKDIRDAQLEFKIVNGRYASTFDSLINFVKTEKSPIVSRSGEVPMVLSPEQLKGLGMKEQPKQMISEQEAWKLAQMGLIPGFKRDTTYIPVMEKIFTNEKALAQRNSAYPFSPDSIGIVPFSGGQKTFIMETGMIDKNNVKLPTLFIKEPNPLTKDTLIVGSLEEVTTNGNWGE